MLDSICLNLENLLVHFLKHNTITCLSFHHYFLQLFNNCTMFFTQIFLSLTNTNYWIIHFSSTVTTSVFTVPPSTVTSCSLRSLPWASSSTCTFMASNLSFDNQPFYLLLPGQTRVALFIQTFTFLSIL